MDTHPFPELSDLLDQLHAHVVNSPDPREDSHEWTSEARELLARVVSTLQHPRSPKLYSALSSKLEERLRGLRPRGRVGIGPPEPPRLEAARALARELTPQVLRDEIQTLREIDFAIISENQTAFYAALAKLRLTVAELEALNQIAEDPADSISPTQRRFAILESILTRGPIQRIDIVAAANCAARTVDNAVKQFRAVRLVDKPDRDGYVVPHGQRQRARRILNRWRKELRL